MTFVSPKYVQVNMLGMDLIQKNQPLEVGSIHAVKDLERIGTKTLIRRLQDTWLLPVSQENYDAIQADPEKFGVPAAAVAVVAPPINAPEPESEPEPEAPAKDEPPQEPANVGPTRNGLTVDEYFLKHCKNPKAKRPTAKCPGCEKQKRTRRKMFECCPRDDVFEGLTEDVPACPCEFCLALESEPESEPADAPEEEEEAQSEETPEE